MTAYFAPLALLPDGLVPAVRIDINESGWITAVAPGADATGAERLAGPVLPGMTNLHSHAFQRAIAGRAEPDGHTDDFWLWRQAMYAFVQRVAPDDVEAIAAHAFIEMVKRGYTGVVEFHYLHRDRDGAAYADPCEMAHRILGAARSAGIGLTLLPTQYSYGGFGGKSLEPAQQRFRTSPDEIAAMRAALRRAVGDDPQVRIGAAFHSLRAVSHTTIAALGAELRRDEPDIPLHIHAAEQVKEVADCVAQLGARPVQWLLDQVGLDRHWCLVHATQIDADEMRRLAASGAVAGLCPSTEADLGDGLFPIADYAAAGGAFGIGTDSHVLLDPFAELKQLDWGQRLTRKRRDTFGRAPSAGLRLWSSAAQAGAQAAGRRTGALAVGQRADLVVLDREMTAFAGIPDARVVDAAVFAIGGDAVRDVMIGGRWVVQARRHAGEEAAARRYRAAVERLA